MKDFIELGADPSDQERLSRFYDELLCVCFPDENERESIENIRKFLDLKKRGWYGDSNYHVLVLEKNGQIIGGSISDYLSAPNVGVIEFLAIAPAWRGQQLSTALLSATEALIHKDAQRARHSHAEWFLCEMDDPAADCCQRDTAEARACIWARWGFRYVDISYVQPALDAQKARVGHLKLLAKRSALPLVSDIAGTVLISVLHEYLRLAMGIDNPPDSAEFRRMGEAISLRDRIPLLPIIA